ncbi:putative ef hand family protein [Blattamonas nauphoetae]|uniref:Ef hand family protein n=1 Tax=Blattamonas nauphoetae TaxID=2049346 RepID=A0ABQ9Y1W0_9EUKA|nr:putative ef hand family protein [Blattamonas nauphoetae]
MTESPVGDDQQKCLFLTKDDLTDCATLFTSFLDASSTLTEDEKVNLTAKCRSDMGEVIQKYLDIPSHANPHLNEVVSTIAQIETYMLCQDIVKISVSSETKSPAKDMILEYLNKMESLSQILILKASSLSDETESDQINALKRENEELKEKLAQFTQTPEIEVNQTSEETEPVGDEDSPNSPKEEMNDTFHDAPDSPVEQTQSRRIQPNGKTSGKKIKPMNVHKVESMIDEIYKAKIKHDKVCDTSRKRHETLEEYIGTFLNVRFGMPQMIVEAYESLMYYIVQYAPTRPAIAVFKAILANEIDEDFRTVLSQIPLTVKNVLHAFLRGKYPEEVEKDILQRLNEKIGGTGKGTLATDEWKAVVEFMYNEEDQKRLIPILEEEQAKESEKLEQQHREDLSKTQTKRIEKKRTQPAFVVYNRFIQILSEHQLARHIEYLSRFRELFVGSSEEEGEGSSQGIVSETGFHDIVHTLLEGAGNRMEPEREEDYIQKLLEKADPFNNKEIPFTDCVRILSSEIDAFNRAMENTSE